MKPFKLPEKLLLIAFAASGVARAAALPPAMSEQLNAAYPAVETFYRDLHSHPELAFDEHQTAAKLAARAKALGFDVTTGVGGTGVVAILRNGPGPTVMLRTEMDALPVLEKTGLPFASKVTTKNAAGETVPVMHACGHDLHMAAWFGTAKLMAENRKAWSGTLMLIGQPAEETVRRRRRDAQGRPVHPLPEAATTRCRCMTTPAVPSGMIMYHAGAFRASSDVVNITMYGQGGHGAVPHETRDPIVMAARIVLALQTLVSRENNPLDPAVITVGCIHGGTEANIIPDEVKLQLSVRTFKAGSAQARAGQHRARSKGEAIAAGAPKEPLVEVKPGTDSVYNDPELVGRVVKVVQGAVGPDFVKEMPSKMTSEDFSPVRPAAGREGHPVARGAVDASRLAAATQGRPAAAGHPFAAMGAGLQADVTNTIKAETAILLDLFAGNK